jgi:hypothetical protein
MILIRVTTLDTGRAYLGLTDKGKTKLCTEEMIVSLTITRVTVTNIVLDEYINFLKTKNIKNAA